MHARVLGAYKKAVASALSFAVAAVALAGAPLHPAFVSHRTHDTKVEHALGLSLYIIYVSKLCEALFRLLSLNPLSPML